MLRDKLVFSINDSRLKERLLRENDLTLRRAIEICKSTELAKTQIQAMQTSPATLDTRVDAIEKARGQKRAGSGNKSTKAQPTMNCQKCGRKHEPRQCSVYGVVCHKCGKNNHFSKVCRTLNIKSGNNRAKTVHNIESEVDSAQLAEMTKKQRPTQRTTNGIRQPPSEAYQ